MGFLLLYVFEMFCGVLNVILACVSDEVLDLIRSNSAARNFSKVSFINWSMRKSTSWTSSRRRTFPSNGRIYTAPRTSHEKSSKRLLSYNYPWWRICRVPWPVPPRGFIGNYWVGKSAFVTLGSKFLHEVTTNESGDKRGKLKRP